MTSFSTLASRAKSDIISWLIIAITYCYGQPWNSQDSSLDRKTSQDTTQGRSLCLEANILVKTKTYTFISRALIPNIQSTAIQRKLNAECMGTNESG